MFLAPPLAELALLMGPREFTALMVFGLTLVIYLSGDSISKPLMMGAVGVLRSGTTPSCLCSRSYDGRHTKAIHDALPTRYVYGIPTTYHFIIVGCSFYFSVFFSNDSVA